MSSSGTYRNLTDQRLTTAPTQVNKFIEDSVRMLWFVVLKCAMYELFSLVGIISNVVSLSVFSRIGCHDSVNVWLVALTISDLVSLLVLLWMGVCYNPWFTYSDVTFDTWSLVYLTGGWPKIYLARVTSWVTAFVTLERCLCIALPLRVKAIFTRGRSIFINASIFLLIFLIMPPIYVTTGLSWQWYPDRNKTLLGLDFTSERNDIYNTVISINIILTYLSFFVVLLSSFVLLVSLERHARWRKVKADVKPSSATAKELKVSRMVLLIAVTFMGTYLPGTALLLVMVFVPEFNKGRTYHNLFNLRIDFFNYNSEARCCNQLKNLSELHFYND
ncbi:uncharacterized protein LOC131950512 [Physella acuta]|uniref:uncharacterized protein LOC131950512 n=1 Tax=Physella acuta TaxID=109671 RepID=UPI0027DC9AD8|nr:uncharacterized protein LOC131950512 [Physella acuta]